MIKMLKKQSLRNKLLMGLKDKCNQMKEGFKACVFYETTTKEEAQ